MIRDPTNDDVARNMRQSRRSHGVSRESLAARSSVGFQSIRAYETGRVYPGLPNLWRLCDALNTSMDEYTGYAEYRRSKSKEGGIPQ